ncbi:SDR family oxidoreductase [Bacillus sp. HMF5848]|uniref:SDR family NAD(P)-dependent oxidoreductase n=1 Tax=Bacillus sp. HMF5848 TaxID=2495421 RepID=UPI000F76D8CD|nr:SDR family oxidoreductase [Bacillus sp. HMF5848]RSK27737.1 SDR family oxidoreductase [Bacillus sp. HMF5848]
MDSLKNKNVVITGASSGIGEKLAYLVAKQGATPILIARSEKKLQDLTISLQQYNRQSTYYVLDVSNIKAVEDVFCDIYSKYGHVDVLINNAGFGVFEYVNDIDLDIAKNMFDVNVLGLIACTRAVYPHMAKNKSGHIINIASQAGKFATAKSSVYTATKHAVLGFTNSLRIEARQSGVFVTSVNPGPVATNFFNIADKDGTYVKNVERYMIDPDILAQKIVSVIFTSTREINMPTWMSAGSKLYQLFPRLVEKFSERFVNIK